MTKEHAIVRLLQHGSLGLLEIVFIGGAGWDQATTEAQLVGLIRRGLVLQAPLQRGGRYRLAVSTKDALRAITLANGVRRLPAGERQNDAVRVDAPAAAPSIQPGLSGVRGPDPLRPAEAARQPGGTRSSLARRARRMEGLRASRIRAAGDRVVGLEAVGGVGT